MPDRQPRMNLWAAVVCAVAALAALYFALRTGSWFQWSMVGLNALMFAWNVLIAWAIKEVGDE